ncbi:MAG TPA: hypothetical protein VHO67_18110 [Polyangia bacterium]|nr:hypothetical protein [Polyangia bacterium]
MALLLGVSLVAAAGCRHSRGRPFAIPVPPQLQTAVAIDREGNQVLVGAFAGRLRVPGGELTSAGGTDIFVTKTSRAGTPVFPPERFGGPGEDAATGVAVDDDGSIVVSGTFQGEIDFGGQRLKAQVRHALQRAVFVARLDPAGKVVWVHQIAVANQATQVSVAVGPDHNIVVGVTATGTVASPAGQIALRGQSVTLEVLSPKGDPTTPAGPKIMALSLPVGCAHSPCQPGDVLVPGCGPDGCVAWICGSDSYCCNVAWDGICVDEVGTICQRRCDCSTICTQGNAFYPDACDCTVRVFTEDTYCSETYWDSICISEGNKACGMNCPL